MVIEAASWSSLTAVDEVDESRDMRFGVHFRA
jgi:hypothetical protein